MLRRAVSELPVGRHSILRGRLMPKSDFVSTLKRAVEQNGGIDKLAGRLEVSPRDIEDWCEGRSVPPDEVLIRLADIVLEDSRALRNASAGRTERDDKD
jgi:hypothetical protein